MQQTATTATLAVLGAGAALALSGCGGTSQHSGSGMMNGSSGSPGMSSTARSGGSGMMGGSGSGYHYSRLSCTAPAALPGTTVTVQLADMGMTRMMGGTAPLGQHMSLQAAPAKVPAGRVSFVAQNVGWRTHELVILPLSSGAPGQRIAGSNGKVAEAGSLGEASGSCAAGTGEGITSGSTGWVSLTLPAGRYELVCNLPNHYANGMRRELDVTG